MKSREVYFTSDDYTNACNVFREWYDEHFEEPERLQLYKPSWVIKAFRDTPTEAGKHYARQACEYLWAVLTPREKRELNLPNRFLLSNELISSARRIEALLGITAGIAPTPKPRDTLADRLNEERSSFIDNRWVSTSWGAKREVGCGSYSVNLSHSSHPAYTFDFQIVKDAQVQCGFVMSVGELQTLLDYVKEQQASE